MNRDRSILKTSRRMMSPRNEYGIKSDSVCPEGQTPTNPSLDYYGKKADLVRKPVFCNLMDDVFYPRVGPATPKRIGAK